MAEATKWLGFPDEPLSIYCFKILNNSVRPGLVTRLKAIGLGRVTAGCLQLLEILEIYWN